MLKKNKIRYNYLFFQFQVQLCSLMHCIYSLSFEKWCLKQDSKIQLHSVSSLTYRCMSFLSFLLSFIWKCPLITWQGKLDCVKKLDRTCNPSEVNLSMLFLSHSAKYQARFSICKPEWGNSPHRNGCLTNSWTRIPINTSGRQPR